MNEGFFRVDQLEYLQRGPFSFSLSKAECVGLSGPSGIGKSLLFRALTDLIPSSGEVSLQGLSRNAIEAPEWRIKVMLLPSDSAWWFERVGDHFLPSNSSSEFSDLLRQFGLPPEILSWQPSRLSTGEKQRLALLRALQYQPDLLLLDEPTSGLDAKNTSEVEGYLLQLKKERELSLMWVSHDSEQLARVADKILSMDESGLKEIAPRVKDRSKEEWSLNKRL